MTASKPSSTDSKLMPSQGVAAGLHWVRGELDQNLQLASQLVEQHAENRQDSATLTKALAHIHEVRGAAVLIQAYGVALLAEEMKQTVQDLIDARVREPDAAYSAIVSACLQAGDYLDLLQLGHNDSALVLQPIVNELRLARGKSLLTEDDLFVAQFRVLGLHLARSTPSPGLADVQAEAGRLSPVFSAALLSWFKDQDTAQALSRIGRVAEILAGASQDRNLYQLWSTAAACIEALLSSTLEDSLELKRQFGRAGQLMKILAEAGERGAVRQMSDVSLRLLFYAGRSTGNGPRVAALRSGLNLDTWLPSVEAIQGTRARLRGANTGLLVRVAEELRADLAEVRDSIDVALRSGASEQEFASTAGRLKRVADTLLVLGLSAESQALAQPLETLRDTGVADPKTWMEFATAVLQVDLSLEGALYRQLQAVSQVEGSDARPPATADLRAGTGALLRESLVNLARIKNYVEAYLKTEDVMGLPEAARLLDEIAAGFRMLAMERAEALVLDVAQFLSSLRFVTVRTNNTTAGRFADAIAAIEYYLELRRDGSPGSDSVLDQLQILCARLTATEASERPPAPETASSLPPEPSTVPALAAANPTPAPAVVPDQAPASSFELSLVDYVPPKAEAAPPKPIEEPEYHLLGVPAPETQATTESTSAASEPETRDDGLPIQPTPTPVVPTPVESEPAVAALQTLTPSVGRGPAASDVDPEIRQVFIEEAEEVLQTLQRALPRWLRQSEDRDSLVTLRRAFHTLKGSGRMVGAQDIGEFAWAMENLLNRCIDRTVEISGPVQDTVRDAIALVPALIAAFRDVQLPPASVARLAEGARRLAAGQELADDEELRAVFRSDALARLDMITRWLADQDRQYGEYDIPEPVVRAFHTLRGAALAIEARPVGELAGSLESYLDTLHRGHVAIGDEGLNLIVDATAMLRQWIAELGTPSLQQDVTPWLARVEAVRAGALDASGQTEEDLQRVEVFSFEALDLVQRFETDLQTWSRAPEAPGHVQTLRDTMHMLEGAANVAQVVPIVALAQALKLRLGAMVDAPPPPAAFFEAMRPVVDVLYQQLDAYREGRLAGDGSEWLGGVTALDQIAAVEPAAVSAPLPASPPPPASVDPELLDVFLLEGEDLLAEIEAHAVQMAAQPGDPQVLGAWQRALHTLKGSARVVGIGSVADLTHRLETATETALRDGPAAHPLFRARVRVAVDGLQELLDEARSGGSGAGARVIARFDAVTAPEPELLSPTEPVPELAVPTMEVEVAPPEPLAVSESPTSLETPAVFEFSPNPEALQTPEPLPAWEPSLLEPTTFTELPAGELSLEALSAELAAMDLSPIAAEPAAAPLEFSTIGPSTPEPKDVVSSAETPVENVTSAAEAGAPHRPAAPEEEHDEVATVDPELFEIFEPEANELLESLQAGLNGWQGNLAASAYSRSMQRDLHTFKGGARMTGLLALGEAAHALETDLVQLDREGRTVTETALRKIGARLDGLYRLYERIRVAQRALTTIAASQPDTAAAAVASEPAAESEAAVVLAAEPDAPFAGYQSESAAPAPMEVAPAPVFVPPPPPLPSVWDPQLFWRPDGDDAPGAESRREAVRVPVEKLDAMLNQAGEISIYRARLEENHASLASSLSEMAQTITRVREQLRLMEVETEAQIAARGFSRNNGEGEHDEDRYDSEFDPLEMDRYSRMQELSRALAESVSDLGSLHASLDTAGAEAEGLLQHQGRINTEVQQGLMGTLMVPFSRQVQRLARVVRQTAEQNGRSARAEFSGEDSELDRNVLERMTAPLEHLLRNAVVHGIEDADTRVAAGKPAEGLVHVALKREGSQLLIEVRDDGRGLDYAAIRAQAVKRNLMRADAQISDDDLARFVFAPGFSTARALTQDAGRGIGMDVVAAEVKQLGGTVDIASEAGRGVRFRIRLPLMLAVSQALVVQVGEELFAIPLASVEGIARAPRESLGEMMQEGGKPLEYGGHRYQVRRLGELVGLPAPTRIDARTVPAILMRLGEGLGGPERRVAVVAERLIGNREIVTKAAGPVLGAVSGVSGATILADGRVMLIVDLPALIAEATRRRLGDEAAAVPAAGESRRLIMVVDDSITIRRVTERLLVRKGYRVITAKDGLDAMATLQTELPDAVLLDIEMPRADGFEVAAFIRNTARITHLPIIMITSRSGDKHRDRARDLGVNRYLIKPYQEDQLLAELETLLAEEAQLQEQSA